MPSAAVVPDLVVDLHGYTWQEALHEFIACYNEALRAADGAAIGHLNVIHGYGSTGAGGVLRRRLRRFLQQHADSDRLAFTPGESYGANPGHTLVRPVRPLPAAHDALAAEILDYCATPRTLRKIGGKFRRHGEPALKAAVDALVKQRRLRVVGKGSRKTYGRI